MDITVDQVLDAMREAVAERGEDYEYPIEARGGYCHYQFDGKPDCLIGVVLDKLGVPYDYKWESKAADVVLERYLGADSTVAHVCVSAQEVQDCGDTWGVALEAAEREAKRLTQ